MARAAPSQGGGPDATVQIAGIIRPRPPTRARTLPPLPDTGAPSVRHCVILAAVGCLCASAPLSTALHAQRRGAPLEITLAHDSPSERATAERLRALLQTHDVDRWLYTRRVVIDERATPFSHPVLTLAPRVPRAGAAAAAVAAADRRLIADFLHEQFHWLEEGNPQFRAAMQAFQAQYPDAPAGAPTGAMDLESTYRHLLVCDLELQVLTELFGAQAAREELAARRYYTWIYGRVLEDPKVREIVREHGFLLTGSGPSRRGILAPQPPPPPSAPLMSPDARDYLSAALDSIERSILRPGNLNWTVLRDSAMILAAGAQRSYDTYPAIEWTLRRANKHSFLQVPTPGAVATMLPGRVGYVHVPQRGGAAVALADSLHEAVRTLTRDGACAWIVDVRANGGGNMWPMLAGVGPLLGDTLVGSFGGQADSPRWHYRHGVSGILAASGRLDTASRITTAPLDPVPATVPVAILFDGGTGSSGEAVVIAFLGRPNVRTFGSPSAGFATVNRGVRLPDGANMVVTTGYNADRRGISHGDQLTPDSLIALPTGWPSPTDRVSAGALHWLAKQTGCPPSR